MQVEAGETGLAVVRGTKNILNFQSMKGKKVFLQEERRDRNMNV